jgi:hypothetical protein
MRVLRQFFPSLTYSNVILTLHPSELSTQVRDCSKTTGCTQTVRPFNFADLHSPIPAKVYFAGVTRVIFNGRLHDTIVDGNYWPSVSIPRAITGVDPSLFKTCKINFIRTDSNHPNETTALHLGIWDPPVTLRAIKQEELMYKPAELTHNPKELTNMPEERTHSQDAQPSTTISPGMRPNHLTPISTSIGFQPTLSGGFIDTGNQNAAYPSRLLPPSADKPTRGILGSRPLVQTSGVIVTTEGLYRWRCVCAFLILGLVSLI